MKIIKLLIIALLLPIPLLSCMCFEDKVSVIHIFKYDLLFKGKVIHKQGLDTQTLWDHIEYTFEIDELIKGEYESCTIKIHSEITGCGINYNVGAELYIFTIQRKGVYHTSQCSLNRGANYKGSFFKNLIEDYKCEAALEWYNLFGDKIAEGQIIDGKPHGYWFINRGYMQLKREGNYNHGKKEGEWKYYKPDKVKGTPNYLCKIVTYKNDIAITEKKY